LRRAFPSPSHCRCSFLFRFTYLRCASSHDLTVVFVFASLFLLLLFCWFFLSPDLRGELLPIESPNTGFPLSLNFAYFRQGSPPPFKSFLRIQPLPTGFMITLFTSILTIIFFGCGWMGGLLTPQLSTARYCFPSNPPPILYYSPFSAPVFSR